MTLKDALDLGTTGVLAVAVIALWTRLNLMTDRFIARIELTEDKQTVIASEVGLSTQRLRNLAQQVKDERDSSA